MASRLLSTAALAAAFLAAILPPLALFPVESTWMLLAVPLIVAVLCDAAQQSATARRRALWWAGVVIGLDFSALLLQGLLESRWWVPYPHILGPLLSLDGEHGYNAVMFEIWLECWIALAVLLAALVMLVRRLRRSSCAP